MYCLHVKPTIERLVWPDAGNVVLQVIGEVLALVCLEVEVAAVALPVPGVARVDISVVKLSLDLPLVSVWCWRDKACVHTDLEWCGRNGAQSGQCRRQGESERVDEAHGGPNSAYSRGELIQRRGLKEIPCSASDVQVKYLYICIFVEHVRTLTSVSRSP